MVAKSAVERGYGAAHKAERQRWAQILQRAWAAGEEINCVRNGPKCVGQPITSDMDWDLGHNDDRTAWTGPECVPCNRGAGGANGAAVTNARKQMTVREW